MSQARPCMSMGACSWAEAVCGRFPCRSLGAAGEPIVVLPGKASYTKRLLVYGLAARMSMMAYISSTIDARPVFTRRCGIPVNGETEPVGRTVADPAGLVSRGHGGAKRHPRQSVDFCRYALVVLMSAWPNQRRRFAGFARPWRGSLSLRRYSSYFVCSTPDLFLIGRGRGCA